MRQRKGTPVPGKRQGAPVQRRQGGGVQAPSLTGSSGMEPCRIERQSRAPGFQQGFLDGPAAQGVAGAGHMFAGMEGAPRGRRGGEGLQIDAQTAGGGSYGQRADDGLRAVGKGQRRLRGVLRKAESGRAGGRPAQGGGQGRTEGAAGKNEQGPGQQTRVGGSGGREAADMGVVGGRKPGRHDGLQPRRLSRRGQGTEKKAERRMRSLHAGIMP